MMAQLKGLGEENHRLKRMYAEDQVQVGVLREALGRK